MQKQANNRFSLRSAPPDSYVGNAWGEVLRGRLFFAAFARLGDVALGGDGSGVAIVMFDGEFM